MSDAYSWRAWLLEGAGIVGLAATWVLLARAWDGLPAKVACHFDLLGRPDSWGSRKTLWILPALATLLYLGLSIVAIFVFPAHQARPIEFEFMAAIKAYVVWMNFFIAQRAIAVSVGRRKGLGKGFCPALLGVLAILIAVYSRPL